MPYIVVTTSSKQLHCSAYWKKGFYDEPSLIHFGCLPQGEFYDKLFKKLKARVIQPFPREMCLHWETSFDIATILDLLEQHGYDLHSTTETPERVSYTLKSVNANLKSCEVSKEAPCVGTSTNSLATDGSLSNGSNGHTNGVAEFNRSKSSSASSTTSSIQSDSMSSKEQSLERAKRRRVDLF